MSWLEFVSSMTGHLAWPVAIVILGLLFRRQLRSLLGALDSWEGFGQKLTFSQRLARMERQMGAAAGRAAELGRAGDPPTTGRQQPTEEEPWRQLWPTYDPERPSEQQPQQQQGQQQQQQQEQEPQDDEPERKWESPALQVIVPPPPPGWDGTGARGGYGPAASPSGAAEDPPSSERRGTFRPRTTWANRWARPGRVVHGAPAETILTSWDRLMDDLSLLPLKGLTTSGSTKDPADVIAGLRAAGIAADEVITVLNDLWELRNRVAHGRHEPTEGQALTYADVVNQLHDTVHRLLTQDGTSGIGR